MCAKWRSGYEPQLILDKIAPLVSVDKEGHVAFSGFAYHRRYAPIIVSAVEFHADIPDIQRENIVTTGIQQAVKRGDLAPDRVKQAISRAERDFLRKKTSDFILATSISFREMPPFQRIKIGGQTITFSKNLPKQFDRASSERRLLNYVMAPLPTDYVAVRVRSSGHTLAEAAGKALASLALLLGIWNFLLTRGTWRWTMGKAGPIADLRLGPLHTLHYPDGELATEAIWYEPAYTKPAPLKDKAYSDIFAELRVSERRADSGGK